MNNDMRQHAAVHGCTRDRIWRAANIGQEVPRKPESRSLVAFKLVRSQVADPPQLCTPFPETALGTA